MAGVYYGISRLSIIPVRTDPDHAAEQVTQLLFGDHYEVLRLSPDKLWALIRVYTDQAEGWIDLRQHHAISEEYFQQINKTEYKITTDIATPVLYKKAPLTIVMGSIVPVSSSELFKVEEQFAFNGEAKSLGQRRDVEFVLQTAKKYLGSPFQWGGKSPFGIDAPALIQMIFRISGYALPRTLKLQAAYGRKLDSIAEAHPGDLAFFTTKGATPSHVGLIADDSKVIHAFGQVRADSLNEEGILVPETKIYTHFLHSVRRVMT
ncbi:MAG: C40 family peptidase [Cyclobacteriaceae bacterium]|nr:C40 family peptidase [Cyclobacteriaceae bacterium]